MHHSASSDVMSLSTCIVLLLLGIGGPIGFVALVIVPPLLASRARVTAAVVLHVPVISATHWNMAIVSEAQGDQGIYAANYRISKDTEIENEEERTYRKYPVGATISKNHFSDLAAAQAHSQGLFITRMIKTDATYGQQQDPWRYQRIAQGGEIQIDGFADIPAVQAQCAACHGNAKPRDFIFTHHLGDQ